MYPNDSADTSDARRTSRSARVIPRQSSRPTRRPAKRVGRRDHVVEGMTAIRPGVCRRISAPPDARQPCRGTASGDRPRGSGSWFRPRRPVARPDDQNRRRACSRSTVDWIIERTPTRCNSCLGRAPRLSGQNRVPDPPAMMTA
jgi:hypothetical protein